KNRLKTIASIEHVSLSGVVPGGSYNDETTMDIVGNPGGSTSGENVCIVFSDMDFIQTYDIKVFEERTWDPRRESDKRSVVINEAAILPFGLKTAKDALNERVAFGNDTLQIIGVVKNFYWESLKVNHRPVLFWPTEGYARRISVRIHGDI